MNRKINLRAYWLQRKKLIVPDVVKNASYETLGMHAEMLEKTSSHYINRYSWFG